MYLTRRTESPRVVAACQQGSDRAGHSRLGPEGLTFGVPSTGAVVARPGREPLRCRACSPAPNTEWRVAGRWLPAVDSGEGNPMLALFGGCPAVGWTAS